MNSGNPYVVDIDLSKFFDRIHHDRLIARMGQRISNKRILRLIGIMLRSGVMINGVLNPRKGGGVQRCACQMERQNELKQRLDGLRYLVTQSLLRPVLHHNPQLFNTANPY